MSKRNGHRRPRRGPSQAFVMLENWLMDSLAWKDLTPNAKVVYLALKRRFNGSNNGTIALGARAAGEALNKTHHSGNRALRELLSHGFLVVTAQSNFNRKTKEATEYRLTELADDRPGHSRAATKDFMSWEPEKEIAVAPPPGTVAPLRLGSAEGA
jgi:hypothetical protein